MGTDPTDPFGNPGTGTGMQYDEDDGSWYELFEGVWRRMTNSAPSA